jgi:hypothetical protein
MDDNTVYLVFSETSTPDGDYVELESFDNEPDARRRCITITTPPKNKPTYAGLYQVHCAVYRAELLDKKQFITQVK